MTQEHPITPPPELVEQWRTQPEFAELGRTTAVSMTQSRLRDIANQSAQWGADQELEACEKWLSARTGFMDAHDLRDYRRPKPPTLKEQALEALEAEDDAMPLRSLARSERFDTIRRALEQLP